MTDMKMADKKMTTGAKLQDKKIQCCVNMDYITSKCAGFCCYFLNAQHLNTLCASYYIFCSKNVSEMLHNISSFSLMLHNKKVTTKF